MTEGDKLRLRVQSRLDALGLKAAEAERLGELKKHYIHDLMIRKKQTFRERDLGKVAFALQCDADYLRGRQTQPRADGHKVVGIIELGAWRKPEDMVVERIFIPEIHDPANHSASIEMYTVQDSHASGMMVAPGSLVSVATDKKTYREGDAMLVRQRSSDGLVETTIRVVEGDQLRTRPANGQGVSIPIKCAEIVGRVVSVFKNF
jgi:hypothetical protein